MAQFSRWLSNFPGGTISNHFRLTLFVVFLGIDLALAQQPLSELGGWPAGALTLLGGGWLAVQCLSESKFDVLPPVNAARLLHKIPPIRELLRSHHDFGGLIRELVLTSVSYSGKRSIHEWDALIVVSRKVTMELGDGYFTLQQKEIVEPSDAEATNGKISEFKLKIVTPLALDMVKFDNQASNLLKDVGIINLKTKKPSLNKLLKRWHALQHYQKCRQKTGWTPKPTRRTELTVDDTPYKVMTDGIKYYSLKMEGLSVDQYEPLGGLEKSLPEKLESLQMPIHYPDALYDVGELSAGATTEGIVSGKNLAIMLAFIKHVTGDMYTEINPLIFCLWIWGKRDLGLTASDNLIITLPPSRFIFPPIPLSPTPNPADNPIPSNKSLTTVTTAELPTTPVLQVTPTASPTLNPDPITRSGSLKTQAESSRAGDEYDGNVLDLSEGGWDIDGGKFLHFWKGLWLLSLSTSAMVTFFTILSGGGNPALATTFGLMFGKPYSVDSNAVDAGFPPSWNGRRRIRWGGDHACGVFKGVYNKKMGPTGTALVRTLIVYSVSWLSWYWREPLRTAFSFTERVKASEWVLWVSMGCEIISAVIALGGIVILTSWKQYKAASACTLGCVAFVITSIFMFRGIRHDDERGRLFLISELSVAAGIFYPAVIEKGIGPSHGPFVSYTAMLWAHMIAGSCFTN